MPDNIRWIKGRDNELPSLCGGNVIHLSGNLLRIVDSHGGSCTHLLHSRDTALMVGHVSKPLFATCEGNLSEWTVTVWEYPSLQMIYQLTDQEQLVHFQFLSTNILLTLSEKTLKLWDWVNKQFLGQDQVESFREFVLVPNQWDGRKFILTLDTNVYVYVVSLCGSVCEITKSLVEMSPNEEPTNQFLRNRLISFFDHPANDSFPAFCLLNLERESYEKYLAHTKKRPTIRVECCCWLDAHNMLFVCDGSRFIKYNSETSPCINELVLTDELPDTCWPVKCICVDGPEIYFVTNDLDLCVAKEQNNQIKIVKKLDTFNMRVDRVRLIPDPANCRIVIFGDKSLTMAYEIGPGVVSVIEHDNCAGIIDMCTFYRNGDYLTTTQPGGKLSIRRIEDGSVVTSQCMPFEISSLCALSTVLFVGDTSGILHVYDTTTLKEPRLIQQVKLFHNPIDLITSDQSVVSFASKSAGQIYFMSADPSRKFEVFGWTDVELGTVDSVSLFSAQPTVCLVASNSRTKLAVFYIENFQISRKDMFTLKEALYECLLTSPRSFVAIIEGGTLVHWDILDRGPSVRNGRPQITNVRNICSSQDGLTLAGLRTDGSLFTSSVELDKTTQFCAFPKSGAKVISSFSGRHIVLSTSSGSLLCFLNDQVSERQYSDQLKTNSWQTAKSLGGLKTYEEGKSVVWSSEMDFDVYSLNLDDLTWKERRELEHNINENEKYSEQKRDIRSKFEEIRESIELIRRENEELPETERLELAEMVIDVERESRAYEECDSAINRMRLDCEEENMSKATEMSQIKSKYWDNYEVKGQSLLMFKGDLQVCNFPMLRQCERETETIHKMESRDKTGTFERKLIQDLVEDSAHQERYLDEPLHTQFHPQSMEYRFDQIRLSERNINQIKTSFNALFDETLQLKRQALIQINQKIENKAKIVKELSGTVPIDTPYKLAPVENPSDMFLVSEEEIAGKLKYSDHTCTAHDKEGTNGDNWRERGLKLMMEGVLQVKKEFVWKEPEMPSFMVEKDQTKWTVEELHLAEEYNRKLTQNMEEYEQYKKVLENEIKKIDSSIEEVMKGFDSKLHNLFKSRINSQSAIFQEEVTIARMKRLILVEQELDFWEVEMRNKLAATQNKIERKTLLREECRQIIEGLHEEYDILVATDKMLEKSLKSKFDSTSAERLSRIFKKRPKLRSADTIEELLQSYKHAENTLKLAEAQRPDDLDPHVWEKFSAFRRQKLESEFQMKKKYIQVTEAACLQGRTTKEVEDLTKVVVPEITRTFGMIADKRNELYYNLEIQFAIKQGQVEINVENGIRNYSDAVLLERSIVEGLNADIKKVANVKVGIMREGKDVMNSIAQLEWEHKKMEMQYEDIINRMREIKNFKVSRDMHKVISNSFANSTSQGEISALEQAIVKQQEHGVKVIREKQNLLSVLRSENRRVLKNNETLLETNFGVGVEVSERRITYEMNTHENEIDERTSRYADMVTRRRMVDQIQENATQLATLRAEAERLRMATFPSLN